MAAFNVRLGAGALAARLYLSRKDDILAPV